MEQDIRHDVKPGMIIRVYQTIKDINKKGEEKERVQMFEGMVLVVKHGTETGATVTVRKVSNGIGVEKIFPINSPLVVKIELVREMAVRSSRAYYLRTHKKKLKEVKGEKSLKSKMEKRAKEAPEKKEVKEEEKVEKVEEKKEA
jgi:large subunit ribosomal protein L19